MNGLRLVAVGRYTATEETFMCDPSFQDSWFDGADNAVDAQPEEMDFADAWTIGEMDADDNLPCDPLQHFSKLADIELYIIGWQEAMSARGHAD